MSGRHGWPWRTSSVWIKSRSSRSSPRADVARFTGRGSKDGRKKAKKILSGVGEVAITPPAGVPLLGCIQRSTGVHDNLYARALVLSDGTERVVIVCLDLIGLNFGLGDELREAIYRHTGISHILLNCSHTHSAPFTIPWSVLGWRTFSRESKAWRGELVRKVTQMVRRAAGHVSESVLRVGRAPLQIGFNRRFPTKQGIIMKAYREGTVVPWVDVLRVDGTNRRPLAVLFSHAAHPVINTWSKPAH